MRIITGTARGCRLKTPKGQDTRPTADRIKESLFNILGQKVLDRKVLDIFAGTGNLGLEALSRGAKSGMLVDKATAQLMQENARLTRLQDKVTVRGGDVFAEDYLHQLFVIAQGFVVHQGHGIGHRDFLDLRLANGLVAQFLYSLRQDDGRDVGISSWHQ